MRRLTCYFVLCVGIVSANSFYTPSNKARRSPEQTLFRDEVAPETGGKVPESAHMRVELNRIDAMGFNDPAAPEMVAQLKDLHLPDRMSDSYHPGHPGHPGAGHLHADPYEKPLEYSPYSPPPAQEGYFTEPAGYHPTAEPYHPPAAYHEPEPYHPSGYHEPEPYHPPAAHGGYHEPEPYHPPAEAYGPPAPYKPKGPVMLEKRPYEPKEIKPVTITTHDTYTAFDCRKVPYPDRHYADPEAGCQIYHYCHADGKQDTFHCPYGTMFNEYLGTCDHSGAVYCKGGEGYAGPLKTPHHAAPVHHGHAPAVHHKPSYHEPSYHEPSYHEPSYHEPHEPHYYHSSPPPPAQYHHPAPVHQEPAYGSTHGGSGFGGGFSFPKGFGSEF